MCGRVVLVTGSNSGIGLETAVALAMTSAVVICAARTKEKCARAIATVGRRSRCQPSQLRAAVFDLGSLAEVSSWAQRYAASGRPLHVLINNAGVMQLPTFVPTADGFESQFGINFLAPWLLTRLLLPVLQRSAEASASADSASSSVPVLSRVVNVSSIAHRHLDLAKLSVKRLPLGARTYSSWDAYASSKLLQIVHAQRVGRDRAYPLVGAIAVHPGVVKTGLGRHQARNPASYTWWIYNAAPVMSVLGMGHKSAAAGAAPSVRAAMDDSLLASCDGAVLGGASSWLYLDEKCRPAVPRLPGTAALGGGGGSGRYLLGEQLDARAEALCAAAATPQRGRRRTGRRRPRAKL